MHASQINREGIVCGSPTLPQKIHFVVIGGYIFCASKLQSVVKSIRSFLGNASGCVSKFKLNDHIK